MAYVLFHVNKPLLFDLQEKKVKEYTGCFYPLYIILIYFTRSRRNLFTYVMIFAIKESIFTTKCEIY